MLNFVTDLFAWLPSIVVLHSAFLARMETSNGGRRHLYKRARDWIQHGGT